MGCNVSPVIDITAVLTRRLLGCTGNIAQKNGAG
jgi:hypothetical protein